MLSKRTAATAVMSMFTEVTATVGVKWIMAVSIAKATVRSEERRVGKEC